MINQRKAGIILSYISELIKIITSLVYTPIMLRLLSISEYGLYQLVHSVVAYLSLLNLGFSSSYIRYYARFKKNNDIEEIHRLNGMFLTVFFAIACIVILCGVVMTVNIQAIFRNGLTEPEYEKARVLMIIMIVNLALTFPNSVFTCITSAHEQFFFQRVLLVLNNVLNPFLTLPLLLLGKGSVGMVSVTTLLTLAQLITNIWFVLKKLNEKFIFHHFRFSLFKDIWAFTFFIFLNQIIDQINWNVDKFLLGRMVGTAAVAVYGLGAQINTMYVGVSSTISSVFVPRINRIVAVSNNNYELSQMFTRIGRLQFMVLSLVLTGFVFLGKPFMALWGKTGYESAYYVTLWLIVPVTVPLIQNLGIEIQRAKNKHQARAIVYFFIAIGNIMLSIPLIRRYGEVGAAIGTAISLVLGNILFMNWYYHKEIGLDIVNFWKSIISFWRALVLPVALGLLMMFYLRIERWYQLILYGTLYIAFFCVSMWLFGMNSDEKGLFRGMIRRIKRKLTNAA